MPIYTFNFTSSSPTGEARVFRQPLYIPDKPPRGSRFHIRQVSATSTTTFANSFKFVNVYIPELMGTTEQVKFIQYTVDNQGTPQLGAANTPGIRYFLADGVTSPFALNVFPNLNLGRHHLTSQQLTLELTPFNTPSTLGSLYSYSVVIEWDTE
jgi:hypothetical protein